MPPFFGALLCCANSFRANLLLGVLGYAVAVVDSTGRNPGLVGTIIVVLVETVVEKELVTVTVSVAISVFVFVV